MSIWEVQLRCRYAYPLVNLSKMFPGLPLNVWSVWHRALLHVPSSDAAKLDRIARGITENGGTVEDWADTPEGRVFLARFTFPESPGVYRLFDESRCWLTPPWYYLDGWAYFRAVTFSAPNLKQLVHALEARGPTELIRKSELPLQVLPSSVWVHALLSQLTERQVEALSAAHRTGYYRFPRSVETDRIAEEIGVARTTFSEHLRKAENRLIDSMMPYIQIYARSVRHRRRPPPRSKPLIAPAAGSAKSSSVPPAVPPPLLHAGPPT